MHVNGANNSIPTFIFVLVVDSQHDLGLDSQGSILLFVHIRPMSNRMVSVVYDPLRAVMNKRFVYKGV